MANLPPMDLFGSSYTMDKNAIMENLAHLNEELKTRNVQGKIALVGGAVMCLVLKTRESTHDIDAIFEPKSIIYECIETTARKHNLPKNWLNDSVKGFMSQNAEFQPHVELSNLDILVATPEYMLAMKCLSSRAESESEMDDIKSLIQHLEINNYSAVEAVMLKYYPITRFQAKTKYIIQEVIDELYPQ